MKLMPRFYGQRIMLREYEREDLVHIRKWVNDPQIVNNLSDIFLFPHSLQNSEQFLNMMLEGSNAGHKGFIIAHKDSAEYIGQIDLLHLDWKNRSAELGIVIGSGENLGKGYGSEAIQLLQEIAFKQMNLHRLELRLHDYNDRAYRCYLKCGFKEEGRKRQNHYANGRYSDTIWMSMLADEYERLRQQGNK